MEDTETVERVECRQKAVFYWKIKNFSQIRDVCFSPDFHVCGHTWYLKLGIEDQSGSIVLTLLSEGQGPAYDVHFSMGILSASGKTKAELAGTLSFYGEKYMIYSEGLIFARSKLLKPREELMPLDVLTITATLEGKSPADGTRDVSVQTGVEGIAADDEKHEQREKAVPNTKDVYVQTRVKDMTSEDGEDEQGEKTGTERVLQDIGKMWPSDEHCDVVFRVEDVEFKAHRAILSVRTPALGAMFRHDTAEKASGVVTIEDCEPAVFEQLLHYVYKGVPREVTPENACPLFTVADKYLVREIKTLCLRCMRDTLGVKTFCSTVALTVMHREDDLLETAVDFFSRNLLDIVQTVQWQTFNRDHSTWANEILIRALKVRPKSFPQEESLLSNGHWDQRNDTSDTDRRSLIMVVNGTLDKVGWLQTVVFDWKVKDFSAIRDGDYYLPPVFSSITPGFHFCGHTWYLQLDTKDWWDSIVLSLWSRRSVPDISCSLGFRSASGKTEMEVADKCSFYGERYGICAAVKKIKKLELSRRREELSPLDVFTVTATLARKSASKDAALFGDGHDSDADKNFVPSSDDETTSESDESGIPIWRGTRDVSVQTIVEGIAAKDGKHEQGGKTDTKGVSVQTRVENKASEDGEDEQGEKTGTERVLQDIGKMWKNDEYCDVVFRVGTVEFKVHRAILSARTPVLGAMFRPDTAETASGVVTIEDCEPAVFEQLLHYVYKGAPREVTPENACPLFIVADKYLVTEVKTLCVRCMRNTLCVDTFCNTVTLSLVHREDELLEAAIDFFSINMLGILQTVQWQRFIRDHSTWANEIMIRALKIREEKKPDGD